MVTWLKKIKIKKKLTTESLNWLFNASYVLENKIEKNTIDLFLIKSINAEIEKRRNRKL